VKPSNILVRPNGETVLVDFGLIRLLPEGRHSTGVTGTPGYVAPEIRHEGIYTAAADRYALGGVAYFLLCGKEPEAAGSIDRARQDLEAHYQDRPELVEHVMTMLDPEPTKRPTVLANWCAQLRNSSLDQAYEPMRLPPIAPIQVLAETPRVSIIDADEPFQRTPGVDKLTVLLPAATGPVKPASKGKVGISGHQAPGKSLSGKQPPLATTTPPNTPQRKSSTGRHLVLAIMASLILIAGAVTFVALRSGSSSASTTHVYTFAPTQLNSGLIVARTWTFDVGTRKLSEALVLTNGTTHPLSTAYDEVIPASVAKSVNSIKFSPQPSEVINTDPVVRYNVVLAAGAARTVRYWITIGGSGSVNVVALGESQLSAQGGYDSASVVAVLKSLYLSPPSLHLVSGSSSSLAIVGVMSNGAVAQSAALKTVQWTSSNPSVASVSNGQIEAHSPGTAAITARAGHAISAMSVIVVPAGSTGSQSQNTGSTGSGTSQSGSAVQSQSGSTKAPASSGASGSQSAPSSASGSGTAGGNGSGTGTAGGGGSGTGSGTGSASGSGTAGGSGSASGSAQSGSSSGTGTSPTTPSTTGTSAPSQSPTPSAQPPATYAETTGGVTNTWTNYQNAGGNQGPSIPTHATVQIACKLTGFAVADGNTWWYRISSSPWNSTYYASADAFYNNGATSGSLQGTPFVDPSVPSC
jgi:hypothetical protein